MANITMCVNRECEHKQNCYRWTAMADNIQSYAMFECSNKCVDMIKTINHNP